MNPDTIEPENGEQMPRESEEHYRLLLEEVSDGVWDLDVRTGELYWNDCLFEMLGFSRSEFTPTFKGFTELVHPKDRQRIVDFYTAHVAHRDRDAKEHDVAIRTEVRMRHSTGEYRYCLNRGRVLRDHNGALIRVTGFVIDVTERKQIEEALRQSEARHFAVVDTAFDAIVTMTADGIIRSYNRGAKRIFGYTAEEATGQPFMLLMPERFRGPRKAGLDRYLNTGETHVVGRDMLEIVGQRKDGEEFPLELSITEARSGKDVLFTGIMRDITERKQAEEELRLRDRAIAASSNGIIITGANQEDNPIIYVNPGFESITGYTAEEAVGRNCRFLQGSDSDQPALNELRAALREGREFTVVLRNYRKDGVMFSNELHVSPIRDEDDRITHFVGVQDDVTERMLTEEALRESEERFHKLTDASLEGIVVTERGVILEVNRAYTSIFGCEPSEIIGRSALEVVAPESVELVQRNIASNHEEPYEAVGMRKDGTRFDMEIHGRESKYRGRTVRVTAIRDVTERKQAEEALRRSEERFRSLVQNASDIITILETDGTIRYESPAVKQVLGYEPEELVGKNVFEYIHSDDAAQVLRMFTRASDQPGDNPLVEFRFHHKDGSWRYLEASGNNRLNDPSVEGIIVNSRDTTERKSLEEHLMYQAFHDPLTGLPNRALFMDRLGHALTRAGRREDYTIAVLFLDLDNFKVINDSLGHEFGDRLLVEMAERLQACTRPEDTVARFGGDEFAVLLEDIASENEATRFAGRVAKVLQAPLILDGHEVFTPASIGIALDTYGRARSEDLLRQADMAMYEAKHKGKARHEVFESNMSAYPLKRLKLESDLRRAIEREEFRVHYQLKVSLETDRVFGMEALVRWEQPERGLLSPGEFIPLAEETGLIVPIGQWVLEEACRQACEWREQYPSDPPMRMCVNLSARQFQHPDLARDVARALQKTGLDPGGLVLEITESVVMKDARSTVGTLQELKVLGVKLAIDDFGTGYSSLSYLKRFPVDHLKIDRFFVEGLSEDPEDMVLVLGMISLGHALGLEVIAEGVETAGQLAQLREMGCNIAQGYYFAKPLPGEEISALFASTMSQSPREGPRAGEPPGIDIMRALKGLTGRSEGGR